jgi:hypothetical protein
MANPFVVSFEYVVRGGVHGGETFSCVLGGPGSGVRPNKLLTVGIRYGVPVRFE